MESKKEELSKFIDLLLETEHGKGANLLETCIALLESYMENVEEDIKSDVYNSMNNMFENVLGRFGNDQAIFDELMIEAISNYILDI